MRVITDEWTGLLAELQAKVSLAGRQRLLQNCIESLEQITRSNFGPDGENRPQEWPDLSENYAAEWHDGDTTPTLKLDDERHELRNPGEPHLVDSFENTVAENSAELTNVSSYAGVHQMGYGAKRRPYYPITDAGELLPAAKISLAAILEKHFTAG